jgi:outer membrane protein OmpA-like peptidoglycan-associated protein
MSCKSIWRNTVAMLAVAACAVLFANSTPASAQQFQVLGASPAAADSSPEVTSSKRLILHDVKVRGASVDPSSRPVLDYAAALLRQDPQTIVNVSGQGDRATVRRQARAVARYLEQHGIAANRLVVQDTPIASPGTPASNALANPGVIVLNLTGPGCATCPS